VAKQQLHGAQVLGATVDQRRLGSPHRMRAVLSGIETKFLDPAPENSSVLPRAQVWRGVDAAREQEILGLQP
jgi:hypothetical protein